MIEEAYCSFEVAKLLKEKGFEISTDKVYDNQNKLDYQNVVCWQEKRLPYISAPTHQMAMAWLREKHNKHCDIGYDIDLEWYFQIVDLKETFEYDYPEPKYYHSENETNFKTYEEAVEAALKYTLENLLK